jgi:hypothetical protein
VDFNLFHFGNSNEWRCCLQPHAPPLVRVFCLFFLTRSLALSPCVHAGGVNIFGCKLSQHLRRCDICPHHCIMHETRAPLRCAHLNAKATSSAEVFLNMSPRQHISHAASSLPPTRAIVEKYLRLGPPLQCNKSLKSSSRWSPSNACSV